MKLRIQAQHLQPGDIVGSGEVVQKISIGAWTPKDKVEVWLDKRHCIWRKYTYIGVDRVEKAV